MNVDELKAKIAECEAKSTDLKNQIQANTTAARALNQKNHELMQARGSIERDKGQLIHDLHKAEKAAAEQAAVGQPV